MSARADLIQDLAEILAPKPRTRRILHVDEERSIVIDGPKLADAILAAGYRKPRTITSRAEVEALEDGSVVADSAGDVSEKRGGLWCSYETAPMTDARLSKYLPATVLHEAKP